LEENFTLSAAIPGGKRANRNLKLQGERKEGDLEVLTI
jgi:hypothetical protein